MLGGVDVVPKPTVDGIEVVAPPLDTMPRDALVAPTNKAVSVMKAKFKEHIEKNFKDGMSWEKRNFVLDHIIPCSSFDLSNVEQQKKCFHYTNIQPLTWDENAMKSNKMFYIFE